MKRLSLITLAFVLLLGLMASPVWAKGAWVYLDRENGIDSGKDNEWHKYKTESSGNGCKGEHRALPGERVHSGTVSWGPAPPQVLVPGQKMSVRASMAAQAGPGITWAKYQGASFRVNLFIYSKDGKFLYQPQGKPKGYGHTDIGEKTLKNSGTWEGVWTVPEGSENQVFRVKYQSTTPGGDCISTFFYGWNPEHSGSQPGDEKAPPLKVTLKADPDVVLLGDKVTLKADVKGGKGPYTFLWLGKHENKSAAVYVTPKSKGERLYSVRVTDASGQTASARVKVTVLQTAEPLSITLSADTEKPKVGQKVNIKAAVSGGTKPYKITWQGGAGMGATFTFVAKKPGTYQVTAVVKGGGNQVAKASITFNVPKPKPKPPQDLKVKLKVSGPIRYARDEHGKLILDIHNQKIPMVLVHRLVTVEAEVSGGLWGNYKYYWGGDRGWRSGDEEPNVGTYVSRLPGRPNLSLQVTDENPNQPGSPKQRGSAQLELIVYGVKVEIDGPTSVPLGPPTLGVPATFTVTASRDGLKYSPLMGKDLFLRYQPHPEARWGCGNPMAENCEEVNNCMGFEKAFNAPYVDSATAVFCNSGSTSVWAEVYAVDGPQKILVGDAYIDVNVP